MRCVEHIDRNINSGGELVKALMENKAIQRIFSVCTILGESYSPWKDSKLKKFAKSQNIADHGKPYDKMLWNGIMRKSCLYRTIVILAVLM